MVPELIQNLNNLGIKVLVPLDRVIYKYISFDVAIRIVENNSLKFSPPTSFNDPFDLSNDLVGKSYDSIILRKWIDSAASGLDSKERDRIYNNALANPDSVIIMMEKSLEKYKALTGITCFSKSYLKTLMWSHYADKHSGVCLGLNILPVRLTGFTLLEVNYADKIIPLNYFTQKPEVLFYWIYTKSKIWAYEEEVRAVYIDKNGLIPFNKNCLKEVYFGIRTTEVKRKTFLKRLKTLGYYITKASFMSMNTNTFDLMENEINLTTI